MRGSKVVPKKTGKLRRTQPVVQVELEGNEELYKAFAKGDCNKCYGTGRKRKIQDGVFIDPTGRKHLNGDFVQPCKCVPMQLFGYGY